MNYSQIAILLLQGSLVSFLILLLFRLRKKLGIGTLFACLGLFQFVQVFLSSTVYVSITSTLIVSPGSAVLFTATLFALLIIYIKEDASESKKIIYALIMVNIVMAILLQTFSWNLEDSSTQNQFNLSTTLFNTSAWVLFVGTIALFLDSLLIIIVFEYISRKVKFLFLQICLTMLFVVCFDSVFFSVLAFWNSDNLISILTSGIISKGFFALFYSVIFYSYLKYFDFKEDSLNVIFKIKDVFQPLTYKQKFENVKKEREKELLILNKEKEQRIEELVLSKQKIQDALELVKENEYSLSQAGRMAKIGYWSYNKLTNTFFWSNPIHEIYGTDPKKGVPNREKIFNSIHKKSIIKLKNATELLESQGVFYDLELQVTNLKNEELWIRNIGEPIYNDENEIIGRRGVLQDITDTKKAQLAFELSKKEIQTSLELLEKRKFSMDEASKTAKIAYHEYDIATDTFIWSEYLYHIFGLDLEKPVPPRKEILALFDEESQKKMKKATQDLDLKGIPYDLELKISNLKNEVFWVRNVAQPVYNQQNEIVGRRGVTQDITDVKKAQLALELSNQKIQSTLELLEKSENSKNEASKMAKIGYVEDDFLTNTRKWSESIYHIFGFDIKAGVPPGEKVAALLDEESQLKLSKAISKLDSEGIDCDIELKINNLRNEEVWVRMAFQPVFNSQNKIVARRGIVQDITDAKKAQLAIELSKQEIQTTLELLEKSEQSYKDVVETTSDLITVVDDKGNFNFVNHASTKFFGIKPRECKGKSAFDFTHSDDVEDTKKTFKEWINSNSNVFSYENRQISTTGIILNVSWKIHIKRENNKVIQITSIGRDVTEQKLKQKELKLSKQNIEAALELVKENEYSLKEAGRMANIGYWSYDKKTDTIFWSEAVHQIYGNNPEKGVPGLDVILSCFTEDSVKKLVNATVLLATKGIPFQIELEMINLKNEQRWIRNIGEAIFNDKKEVIGRRGVSQDITAQKIKQNELDLKSEKIRDLNNALSMAQELAHVGSWFFNLSSKKTEWSDETFRIWEFDLDKPTPDEDAIRNRIHIDDLELFNNAAHFAFSQGIPYDIEFRINIPNQEQKTLRSICQPLFDDNGKVISLRGTNQDITAQKIKQNELDLKSAKINDLNKALNEAQELSHLGSWEYIIETDAVTWSKELFNIFDRSYKLGAPNYSEQKLFYTEESFTILTQAVNNCIEYETPYDLELDIYTSNGTIKHIISRGRVLKDTDKKVVGCYGTAQDITQIKLAQNELDAQNEKLYVLNNALNEAQRLTHVGSWEWNMTTDTAEWTDEMYNIYGVTKDHFYPSNENVLKTVLPDDINKIEQGISSLLVDKLFVPFEFRIRRPSGEIRHLYIAALKQNSKESIFGVTKDITERKKIEENNLIIKDRYQKLFNNASVAIFNEDLSLVFDKMDELKKQGVLNIANYIEQQPEVLFSFLQSLIINKVNKATLKLFKAKNSKDFLDNIHRTFGKGADKVFGKLIEAVWNNEKSFTSEVNYKTLEGDEFAAIISVPIPQTIVERKTVPVSVQSIQSIKEAELAKKESINRLNEAQKLAKIGSWLFTPSTQEIIWSDETFNIWDFDSNKAIPKFMDLLDLVHKNDRKLFIRSFTNVTNKGTAYDIEFRICLPNHKEKWIRSICKPVFDDEGKVISLKGVNQDITAQKLAKEKIEKADEMYRLLTDNSNDLICLQEPDSTFKYISPSVKTLLGYEASDFLGKKIFSIIHKEDINGLRSVIEKRTLSRNYSEAISFRVRHKDGHYVWLEFLSSPVYKGKEISYFVTTSRDITLWVLAKQEIQEYQTSLQKLTTEITLIEEKQKKEIASNIHDHLSQSLVISKMRINELKRDPSNNVINEDLKFIETHISEALENSRKITYELSPPVLYQLGIIDALNWLLDDVEATHNIVCQFKSNVNNIKLSDVKSILLYRSIQEVIKNAIKYANASLITLNFDKNNLGIYILIKDDGVGFDTNLLKNLHNHSGSGFGLFTVQERIKNIKGKFTIESEINTGTSVKIFIPLAT